MHDLNTTNKLLLIIVVPLLFYILQILSFIFVPFMFAVFLGLLFTPLMRWLKKRHFHKIISLFIVLVSISACFFILIKTIQLTGNELVAGKNELYEKLDVKVAKMIAPFSDFLGFDEVIDDHAIEQLIASEEVKGFILGNFGITFNFVKETLSKTLLTFLFLVLLLAGSLNIQTFINDFVPKEKKQVVKTYMTIEQSVSKFLKVKFLVSLFTGVSFGLICYFLDISFPLFWGLFAFSVNFIQVIGTLVVTLLVCLFATIELSETSALVTAISLFIGAQVLFGSILEPILLGKSFSINIIFVIISLMFWGFLWGIPGLVLAIPMTVLIKTVLGEFEGTKNFSKLMS